MLGHLLDHLAQGSHVTLVSTENRLNLNFPQSEHLEKQLPRLDFLLGVELFQLLCDVLGDDSDVLMTQLGPDVVILVQDHFLHISFSSFIFIDVIIDVKKIQRHRLN